jgi:hypothetical protein
MEIMKELSKEDIKELKEVWSKIKSGRAESVEARQNAVVFWNRIAGTKFKKSTGCGACLSSVYNGLKDLYNEFY